MRNWILIKNNNIRGQCLTCLLVLIGFLFCTLIYWRYFGGIRMLAHDTINYNYPWRVFLSDSVRIGVFPWWDPFTSPGFPIAYPASPNYYLLALVVGFFRTYDVYSFLIEILITHLLAFAGMYFWLRAQVTGKILALVGAIGFSGCGPLVTSLQSYPVQVTMMMVPWFFLGIHLLVCSARYRLRTRILGIVHITWSSILLLTGGYLVIILPMIFFGSLYGFWEIWNSPHKIWQATLGVVISAVIILLILLLPLSEYIQLVHPNLALLRGIDAGFDPYNSALPPASLLTLFLPSGVYLHLITVGRAEQAYMGLLLGLSFLLPLAGIPFKRRDLKSFIIAAIVALVAMGSWNPLSRLFVEYTPGIRWLRFHVFWVIIVEFLLITVAVMMLGRLLRKVRFANGKKVIRRALILIWTFVLILLGASSIMTYRTGRKFVLTGYDYIEYTGVMMAGIIASLIWFWLVRKQRNKVSLIRLSTWFLACIFLTTVLLIVSGHFLPRGITQFLVSIFNRTNPNQTVTGGLSALAHILNVTTYPVNGWTMFKMDGIHVVWVLLSFSFILWNYHKGTVWMSISILIIVFLDLGVATQRYNHGNPYWIGNPPSENERRICYSENKREQGNENVPPFFSRQPYLYTYNRFYNPKIIEMANQPETGPFLLKLAYFTPTNKIDRVEEWKEKGNTDAIKSIEFCPNQISLLVDSGSVNGFVVVTDSWAPGWKAAVNGIKQDVTKVNGSLKGVEIPSGQSSVVLSYRPVYLIPGLISLFLGLGILIGLVGWVLKKGIKPR